MKIKVTSGVKFLMLQQQFHAAIFCTTTRIFAFGQIQEVFPEIDERARDEPHGPQGRTRKSNKVMLTRVPREKADKLT